MSVSQYCAKERLNTTRVLRLAPWLCLVESLTTMAQSAAGTEATATKSTAAVMGLDDARVGGRQGPGPFHARIQRKPYQRQEGRSAIKMQYKLYRKTQN